MDELLVSCLTATYGRFTVLREAVSCFLHQDYQNKELIILNNHPVPLRCDLPQVRIYNEPGYPTLGDCRNRLIELANGDYVRTWDDDDLYLPWAISQGIQHVKGYAGCKPSLSWDSRKNQIYRLGDNVYEAAMTVQAGVARRYGYKPSGGDEHLPLLAGLEKEEFNKFQVTPKEASYCYRWDTHLYRASGTLGGGENETDRALEWRKANDDHGNENPLTPADVSKYYQDMRQAAEEA